MQTRQGAILFVALLAASSGCLRSPSPSPVDPKTDYLAELPLLHRIEQTVEISAGGWVLWMWKNADVIPWSNLTYERNLLLRFEPQNASDEAFWAGAYAFNVREGFLPSSTIMPKGYSLYRNASYYEARDSFMWGELRELRLWEVATEGLLVFSEVPGRFLVENELNGPPPTQGATVVQIPDAQLGPIARGNGMRSAYMPPARTEEIKTGVPDPLTVEMPDFSGGFAAMWMIVDSLPPYAYAARGPFHLRLSNGETLAKTFTPDYATYEQDPRECLAEHGSSTISAAQPSICRHGIASDNQFHLPQTVAGCQPPGPVTAHAEATSRGFVRYSPAILAVPVNFCDFLGRG